MEAMAKAEEENLFNIEFMQGSATSLPFPDSSFGLVTSRLAIHHFTKPRPILDEMARVTTPGCQVVLVDLVASRIKSRCDLNQALGINLDRQKPTTDWRGYETLPTPAPSPSLDSLVLY